MEPKFYQQLKTELLGSLAGASERHDAAYQHAVERYAPEAESGIKPWGREAIARWLSHYNALVSRPVRLRYYQIMALYFTEGARRALHGLDSGLVRQALEVSTATSFRRYVR